MKYDWIDILGKAALTMVVGWLFSSLVFDGLVIFFFGLGLAVGSVIGDLTKPIILKWIIE